MTNNHRQAVLMTDGWAGYMEQPIIVISETPKRYRIIAKDKPVRLAGRQGYVSGDSSVLVPKYAVKFV